MSNKTLKLLGIVFVIFIVLILLQQYLPEFNPKEKTGYEQAVSAVSPESVSSVEIQAGGDPLKLVKSDNAWRVGGKKADSEKISDLLNQLIKPAEHELVAQTNTRHAELKLTDELATSLKLNDSLTILAGPDASQGVYVRVKDNDSVYLLPDLSQSLLATQSADWFDKTIIKADENSLTKIALVHGNESIMLVKEDSVWKLEDGKQEIGKENIQPMLTDISSFAARNLADNETAGKFPKTKVATVIIDYSGKSETLEFYDGETEYLVRRTSDGENFIIGDYQAEHFLLSRNDLLKPAAQPTP